MHRIQIFTVAVLIAALAPVTAAAESRKQRFEDLAAGSDKVTLGTVGVKSSHWGDDGRIYTDVLISPDVTIKGEDEGVVTVQVQGGSVGDTRMTVSDGPELEEGSRVVVFLKRERGRFVVVGRAAGTIPTTSAEVDSALDGAFTHVERGAGRRFGPKRSLANSYVSLDAVRGGTTTTTSAAQVGCYNTDGAKWGTTSATYKIGTSIPAAWNASIDTATSTWNAAGVNFRLVNDPSSVNEISYADLVAKYGASYSNTYAVTTTWSSNSTRLISRATTEFNTKWQWSPSGQANMADVQNILTHELGHWMRLLDIYSPSTCSEVTMWSTASMGETKKRTLEQADIDGFSSLYTGGGSTTVGAPTLTSPANGTTGVSTTPTLTWTAASNATSYDVYFGTTPSPGLASTVSGTSVQTGTLTAGTTYYWRVVAKGASGTASSATFSFTVAAGTPGNTSGPTLLTPANGATGVALTVLMQWTAVSGAVYDLYVGTTPNPSRIGTVGSTSVNVRGFRSGTVYYWKVVARTNSGSFSSAVSSFQTR